MPPRYRFLITSIRSLTRRHGLLVPLLALLALAASACGATGGSVTSSPTHTPTASSSGHGMFYAFASNVGSNEPTSTDIYAYVSLVLAFNTRDGSIAWQHLFNGNAQPNSLIAP